MRACVTGLILLAMTVGILGQEQGQPAPEPPAEPTEQPPLEFFSRPRQPLFPVTPPQVTPRPPQAGPAQRQAGPTPCVAFPMKTIPADPRVDPKMVHQAPQDKQYTMREVPGIPRCR